ncbi:AN1-type zinc finger protein 5-like [Grus japonensis]|uniref:AN1-type zinc finger protein 5-like n=1 Tax=Grus japonensis TaxID=30415 RepID=A0ABC9Y4K7_GRUJA
MGETTLEQFVKDCSPWERLTLEKFMEDCLHPVSGTPCWSRGTMKGVLPLQPMEDDGGADIRLQPMEDPMLEQMDAPKGGCDSMEGTHAGAVREEL